MAETKKTTTAAKPAAKKATAAKPAAAKKAAPKATTAKAAPKAAAKKAPAKKATTAAKPAAKKATAAPKTTGPAAKAASLAKTVLTDKISTQAIFDAIMSERASLRQGTHKVKHRGEVRGGGKKPFAQKHTGNARAGSTRSPIWVGGGTVFGPTTERNYNLKVNKKVRKLAYRSALTLKANDNAIFVDDIKLSKISTKDLLAKIAKMNLKKDIKKLLIVTEDANVFKSGANVQTIQVQKLSGLSVEQIVWADAVIFSKESEKALEGKVAK